MTVHLLKSGQVIESRYKIQKYIGEGGMQQVYRAIDTKLRKEIALKTPMNDSAQKRFARSAAMSAKVTHPNVAKTLDYFVFDERQYLIEEYIAGADLKKRLSQYFFYLDPHLAAHVFHHMAKALAAVHDVGVFHRDLKPSNVMVSMDDNIDIIKITDFGVAKMAQEEIEVALKDDESTLGSKTAVGAIPYMAPELIEDAKSAGLSSDVWSLGAIAFELLSGKRPFGDGLSAVAKIVEAKQPDTPSLIKTKQQFKPLSDELLQIVLSCLQKDPDARPTAAKLVKRCSKLCYSTARRSSGFISAFKRGTGAWGFIERFNDHDSVFFHGTSYYGHKPEEGSNVIMAEFPGTPNCRAFPVLPIRDLDADS